MAGVAWCLLDETEQAPRRLWIVLPARAAAGDIEVGAGDDSVATGRDLPVQLDEALTGPTPSVLGQLLPRHGLAGTGRTLHPLTSPFSWRPRQESNLRRTV